MPSVRRPAEGDMFKAVYDPDKDGVIALAQLVAGVCSEAEADTKVAAEATARGAAIATHAALATHLVSGPIIIWHGTIANIPSGWVICDGNNSTPNLLTKFIEGVATAGTDPGATGGAIAKTTAGHATPSHTLSVAETPAHKHTLYGGTGTGSGYAEIGKPQKDMAMTANACDNTGGGGGHTHSSVTDSIADIRPLYYDVAFLMKT